MMIAVKAERTVVTIGRKIAIKIRTSLFEQATCSMIYMQR